MKFIKEYKWQLLLVLLVASILINVSTCTQTDRTTTLESENRYLENQLLKQENKNKSLKKLIYLKQNELDSVIREEQFIKIKYNEIYKDINGVNSFPAIDSLLAKFYRRL